MFHIAGQVIPGRATYQPGWRWTQYVGPTAGAKLCEVDHLGLVVGDEPYVSLHLLGAGSYTLPAR